MKKGCFIKVIIALTIIIAAVLYIVENHFDDLILKPGEVIIKDIVFKEINKKMQFVKNTPEKDSLKALMSSYLSNKLHNERKLNSRDFEDLIDSINTALDDSIISPSEYQKLKSSFEKEINERPKKNRN